jgi:imidazolonepropionase-like amidohydrolase
MPTRMIEVKTESYALNGRIVTMNPNFDVLERGTIYIREGVIVAVHAEGAAVPVGFENCETVETEGTIFPGLIELHNHLSYNVLPLWNVPERFERREQWRDHPDKRRLITAPMSVLGKNPHYAQAVVRYVECKCLVAGVTTSQGIGLYGVNLRPFYRGVIRNVEAPSDLKWTKASTKIDDVKNAADFFTKLQRAEGGVLLHLCEGVGTEARQHFERLQIDKDNWAITKALIGIHSTALTAEDFQRMGNAGASIVWSPLSNLLLYAETTNIQAALAAGVTVALGSDWSPSGSKNLLCELKVAQLFSFAKDLGIAPEQLVAMVTINPARMLHWDKYLGSIEPLKQADLLVIKNKTKDAYQCLINATENDVTLVVINGVPRYGSSDLMARFGSTEQIMVGDSHRHLNLWDEDADRVMRDLTLGEATIRLKEGFGNLATLAEDLEKGNSFIARLGREGKHFENLADAFAALEMSLDAVNFGSEGNLPPESLIFLELDEHEFEGFGFDGHLENGAITAQGSAAFMAAGTSYSELLRDVHIRLDPLTIVDDSEYFNILLRQINLPVYIKEKLIQYYDFEPTFPDEADFLTEEHESVKVQFLGTMKLADFLQENQSGYLTLDERIRIVKQALVLLEQVYVHLPLKKSMHAVDPVQRLRLLLFTLQEMSQNPNGAPPPELQFHMEMLSIFTSLRDLHTHYVLPYPYQGKVAFLPFMIEEYFEDDEPHYIVTKVLGNAGPKDFKQHVEILYWNGVPIRRAIELNAERFAGSNAAARHARGIDTFTIRPLHASLPPDEAWVTIRYRLANGEEKEYTQDWLVFSQGFGQSMVEPVRAGLITSTAMGVDWHTDAVSEVKTVFYAPNAVEAHREAVMRGEPQRLPNIPNMIDTTMPTIFRAQRVDDDYGYIRIFSFNVTNAEEFVDEFVRLTQKLPNRGLIIDIRANGGGLIFAAERLLQVLPVPKEKRPIEPSRAQFINTLLTLRLCNVNSPSTRIAGLNLKDWKESIRQAVRTGAVYSRALPLTDKDSCNNRPQAVNAPVVLIVDGLCYSAADVFAAGFQDHKVGRIIGIATNTGTEGANTGAGGANVWSYSLLRLLLKPMTESDDTVFEELPHGTDMRVAIRSMLRVYDAAGTPLEDLGITPDYRYLMSRDDILKGNKDLIQRACKVLDEMHEELNVRA